MTIQAEGSWQGRCVRRMDLDEEILGIELPASSTAAGKSLAAMW